MIKKITFMKMKSLIPNELLELNFSKHINVILGPKGGGKSTLFDLLAGLKKGYLPTNATDALESFNLKFIQAEKFNGELISFNQLDKKKDKEKRKDFELRNDIIFQDDPIKKDINKAAEIDEEKYNHIKEVFQNNNKEITALIDKIENFYDKINFIVDKSSSNDINWTNTFLFKDMDIELNIIGQANYNNVDIKLQLQKEKNTLKTLIEKYKDDLMFAKNFFANNRFNVVYNDETFNNELVIEMTSLMEQYLKILKILMKRNEQISRIENIVLIFDKVYKKKMDEIKNENFAEQGLKTYDKESKDFFRLFAKNIFYLKKDFDKLTNQDVYIDIDDQPKECKLLSYKLKNHIKISEDLITDILKVVLHTPRSSKDVSKWILENMKDSKSKKAFNREKIINKLSSSLKDEVIVLANGQEYDKMSLGQRSIYGIKYKFNKSIDEDIFLDQPEDNLDNNTIATNVLDLINKKENNQVFIVTHNANIGILSKPEKVIVADLNNPNCLYSECKLQKIDSTDSESTIFLEGGLKFLEERYKIVKGE